MIMPAHLYRRIAEIDRRLCSVFDRLPDQAVLASGIIERGLEHLPDDERREVLRLLEHGLDEAGMLDHARFTESERAYLRVRLNQAASRLRP